MAKIKTLCKPKKSAKTIQKLTIKKNKKVIEYSPTKELLDENLISNAIWECLKNNNSEGVIEVLQAYIEAVDKEALCKEASLPRSTLYHSLKEKNPTIKTLAKLISAVHAGVY